MNENVNIPLLRKAVEWAEAEAAKPPELCEWEQGYYVLPATAEEAAAVGVADLLDWHVKTREAIAKADDCGTCYCIAGYVAHQSGVPFTYCSADEVARVELGLRGTEARALFDGGNTIQDVRRIAEEIAGERL